MCQRASAEVSAQSLDNVSFEQCRLYLAISDLNRNDSMDSDPEYIRYLNYWSSDAIGRTSFNDLSPVLLANFNAYARLEGEINLQGALPGTIPTTQEAAFLLEVCEGTRTSLKIALGLTAAPSKTYETPAAAMGPAAV